MKTLAQIAIVLAFAATGAGAGAARSFAASGAIVEARDGTSIPPNCTLNPWTHKYTCHKWPKGTVSKG